MKINSHSTVADTESAKQVTLWIDNLSPEETKAALQKFCFIAASVQLTMAETVSLIQVLYRTISGNTFTESAESIAARTGHDRKTILKGLNQAVQQNILKEKKRPGTSTEYSFKPIEKWLHSPVVHNKDIRSKKIVEFSSILEATEENDSSSNLPPVLIMDDQKTEPSQKKDVPSKKKMKQRGNSPKK